MTADVQGVLLLSVAGVVAGAMVGTASRDVRAGLAAMLDLWTGASLLRLSADAAWIAIGVSATLVILRKVVSTAFRHAPV